MNYPVAAEVDAWCDELLARADAMPFEVERIAPVGQPSVPSVRHCGQPTFLKIEAAGRAPFWCYWQPVPGGGPAPLLVHLPGYGAEWSAHPELVAEGWNVLHVNPLGYFTPAGPDESKKRDGSWPVLPDVALTRGEGGYREWLTDALLAVRWACGQPCVQADRVATFGTSQGGGGSLLLGSLLRGRGLKAIAADVPYLTNFQLMAKTNPPGAYANIIAALKQVPEADLPAAWRAVGFIDTLSHAHRFTLPVLLTAGKEDTTTPPASIRSLYDLLPATRSYTEMTPQGHGYTTPFLYLARAWFKLYV